MYDESLRRRFNERVDIPDDWEYHPEKNCWIWTGWKDRDGYGRISSGNNHYKAHRIAYELFHGRPILSGLLVLHKCDNPSCCNPYHLYLGTHMNNSRDMINRGRANPCIGSEQGRSILTENNIIEILKNVENRIFTSVNQIAIYYGVSLATISQIFDGRTWKHVTQEKYTIEDLKELRNKLDTRGILKFNDIRDIRIRLSNNETVTSIAKLYGISYNSINSIKLGISWKNVK